MTKPGSVHFLSDFFLFFLEDPWTIFGLFALYTHTHTLVLFCHSLLVFYSTYTYPIAYPRTLSHTSDTLHVLVVTYKPKHSFRLQNPGASVLLSGLKPDRRGFVE